MRIWYDTEFIDDGKTIDLISIGMFAEDGREYYAQSVEFNPGKASDWVNEHVISHLPICLWLSPDSLEASIHHHRHGKCPRYSNGCPWRSRVQIANEVADFCNPEIHGKPEFWTYYGAYDHVALAQLFGPMIGLPPGWPMYSMDIKQWCKMLGDPNLPEQGKGEHNALADAKWNKLAWEFLKEQKQ
jgi:hypothetical protein